MQVSAENFGLALPVNVNFYFATNTGRVYAKYNDVNGDTIFVPVDGDQFAADLVSANVENHRPVTNADIDTIITDIYDQAVVINAGKVTITAPRCKAVKKSKNKKSA